MPPSWFDFQGDCTSGTGKGECAPSPGAATWGTRRRRRAPAAGHDQMTLFATRKRLHMQYPPDPLDKWIARDIQLSPGGGYVDNTPGETGKADRLVRIVDRYMPRIAEENRILRHGSGQGGKMLRRARGIRRKIRARRRQRQGEAATPPKDEPPQALRPANMGEDAEQYNDGSFVEDTPPDWGGTATRTWTWQKLRKATSKAEGEEADSPANPWPWGPEGRPSDTGRSQGVLAERPAEPARAPQPTGETPTAQRGHPVTTMRK